jgi:3-keto-5-aminohexanoate cleavage enzyme
MITAAINGAEVTREHTPWLPLTPEEVGAEALRCAQAGASILHLHGRRPDGSPTQDLDTFRAYFEAIREKTDVIVQFSTGGAIGMDVEQRIEALALSPEMATLTTGSTNFGDDVFSNPLPLVREIASRMRQFDVRVEVEVFDVSMLDTALRLLDEGLLGKKPHFDFVFGVPGAMAARESHLDYLVSLLPEGATWSVAAIGRHELPMAKMSIDRGGHVRVGLEDNIFLSRGVLAEGSSALVAAVAELAQASGRGVMTIAEARRMLGVVDVRWPCG